MRNCAQIEVSHTSVAGAITISVTPIKLHLGTVAKVVAGSKRIEDQQFDIFIMREGLENMENRQFYRPLLLRMQRRQ